MLSTDDRDLGSRLDWLGSVDIKEAQRLAGLATDSIEDIKSRGAHLTRGGRSRHGRVLGPDQQ